MTNCSLKPDQNQLTLYVHPWYEALNELENITPCEFGLTLKPSEEVTGPKSIEWAAGLYEGEGCLTVSNKEGRWRLFLEMTDSDVVKEFHKTIGVGKFYGPWKHPSAAAHYKPIYVVRVNNKHDIFKVICDFYPYVGERRRAKFDEFLTTYGN